MSKVYYIKDTKKFWQARDKTRSIIDGKRASSSYTDKVKFAEKLRLDAKFLKSGVIVSSKDRIANK